MTQTSAAEIIRLPRAQFAAARDMLTHAFFDYPLMVYTKPDPARRLRGVATLYGAIVRDTLRYGEVHVSPGVTGACCWLPPGVKLPNFFREVRSGMLGLPLGFGWAGFRRLVEYDELQRQMHDKYAKAPHWFLATIGVDPAHQGQGIGSALMAPVLARANRERMPCYLETHTTGNVRLYERHGFQVVEHHENATSVPLWAMFRPPAS